MSRLRYSPPRWQTARTYCQCSHHRDAHERRGDGTFRRCTAVLLSDGRRCPCLSFHAQEPTR